MKLRVLLSVLTSSILLFAVSVPAQVAVNLAYDGDGNLVAKTVNGVTTQYLIDDLNPTGLPQVMEETVNGVAQRRYTYGLQRISETQLIKGAWTTSYYVYDAGGNVRQLTDATGVVTDTYDYDAFGNLIGHTGNTPNVYLYRGERYDPDLGLYYLRARWYNPVTGRFMSRDPEEGDANDPASLHKYAYANGDPVDLEDPTGNYALPGAPTWTPWPAPSGPQPVPNPPPSPNPSQNPRGSAGFEYALIVGTVALTAAEVLPEIACRNDIELAEGQLAVSGATKITPDWSGCSAKGKSCKLTYPQYIPIGQLGYPFANDFAAYQDAVAWNGGRQLRRGSVATAKKGPCGYETSSYVPGTHQNLLIGGKHAGDIVSCTACDDSTGDPILITLWDYIP